MTYPEHEKLSAVADVSQEMGELLDFTFPRLELEIAERDENGRLWPTRKSIQSILAEHFGIDQRKLSAEKDQMLEAIRSANAN